MYIYNNAVVEDEHIL